MKSQKTFLPMFRDGTILRFLSSQRASALSYLLWKSIRRDLKLEPKKHAYIINMPTVTQSTISQLV
ncbi:hypothetical protein DY000_02002760 [Brassica cretica]|uniref:CRAL-TRIO domain-containing protein n=1 Tax=Brassica cretica TaxID=69181 RepID=A0ABQ7CED7_BRACR|nr:hypothetical protein DY000_02002760 [Brassica cretica]